MNLWEYKNDHLQVVTLRYRSWSSREGLKNLQPQQVALSAVFQDFPFYLCVSFLHFLKASSGLAISLYVNDFSSSTRCFQLDCVHTAHLWLFTYLYLVSTYKNVCSGARCVCAHHWYSVHMSVGNHFGCLSFELLNTVVGLRPAQ